MHIRLDLLAMLVNLPPPPSVKGPPMLPFRLFLHFTLAIGIWLILLSAIATIGSLFVADGLFFTAAAIISTPLVILGGLMVYGSLLALKENASHPAATLPANSAARYPRPRRRKLRHPG